MNAILRLGLDLPVAMRVSLRMRSGIPIEPAVFSQLMEQRARSCRDLRPIPADFALNEHARTDPSHELFARRLKNPTDITRPLPIVQYTVMSTA